MPQIEKKGSINEIRMYQVFYRAITSSHTLTAYSRYCRQCFLLIGVIGIMSASWLRPSLVYCETVKDATEIESPVFATSHPIYLRSDEDKNYYGLVIQVGLKKDKSNVRYQLPYKGNSIVVFSYPVKPLKHGKPVGPARLGHILDMSTDDVTFVAEGRSLVKKDIKVSILPNYPNTATSEYDRAIVSDIAREGVPKNIIISALPNSPEMTTTVVSHFAPGQPRVKKIGGTAPLHLSEKAKTQRKEQMQEKDEEREIKIQEMLERTATIGGIDFSLIPENMMDEKSIPNTKEAKVALEVLKKIRELQRDNELSPDSRLSITYSNKHNEPDNLHMRLSHYDQHNNETVVDVLGGIPSQSAKKDSSAHSKSNHPISMLSITTLNPNDHSREAPNMVDLRALFSRETVGHRLMHSVRSKPERH